MTWGLMVLLHLRLGAWSMVPAFWCVTPDPQKTKVCVGLGDLAGLGHGPQTSFLGVEINYPASYRSTLTLKLQYLTGLKVHNRCRGCIPIEQEDKGVKV